MWSGEIAPLVPAKSMALLHQRLMAEASTAAWGDYFLLNTLLAALAITPAILASRRWWARRGPRQFRKLKQKSAPSTSVLPTPTIASQVRSTSRKRLNPQRPPWRWRALHRRNHFLAEFLDRAHHLVMRNGLGLHNQHHLVDADVLVHHAGLDAGFGVAGNDDAAIRQGLAVQLRKGGARPRPGRNPGRRRLPALVFCGLHRIGATSGQSRPASGRECRPRLRSALHRRLMRP